MFVQTSIISQISENIRHELWLGSLHSPDVPIHDMRKTLLDRDSGLTECGEQRQETIKPRAQC